MFLISPNLRYGLSITSDDEESGFRMRIENGTKPENGTVCKNGLQTEVIFVCDKTKQWNGQDISDNIQLVYHHGDDPCMVCLSSLLSSPHQ